MERTQHHFGNIPADTEPQPEHEEPRDKLTVMYTLQNNWPSSPEVLRSQTSKIEELFLI